MAAAVHLGLMLRAADVEHVRVDKLSISTSLLVRAAEALGFSIRIHPGKVVWISNGYTDHYFKGTSLPSNDMVAATISSNKYLSRQLLKAQGIPTPKTITIRHPGGWQRAITGQLQFPLVVKPVAGAHAGGATMNIRRPATLRQGVRRAFHYMKRKGTGDRALVEEYFSGKDLRLFVIGDVVVSTIHREPAYVIGDNQHTIRQLVHNFNEEWKSTIEFDYPLCPIPLDAEVGRRLKRDHRRLSDVPGDGDKVELRWNANVSTGGRTHDVTDTVHPALQQLAVRTAQTLHLPIAGVDILAKDFTSADTTDTNVVVLEANDAPGIDIHHFPYVGKSRDVAGEILKFVFRQTNLK